MRKLISLLLTVAILFTVSLAFAGVIEPVGAAAGRLAGKTVSATVGAYDEETKTFTVTVYDYDRYDQDDVAGLAVGDTVLAGGRLHKITGTVYYDDGVYWQCDDGEEICFGVYGDDVQACSSTDRVFMSVVAVLHIPAAEGIVYEDFSDPDPDAEPIVAEGLEAILEIKAEKEETSNGFSFYATTITLNKNLEIVKICREFDVAQ